MSENYKHACIKPDCDNTYTDGDPDAYYCKSCVKANKVIAKELDAKLSTRSRSEVVSDLQQFDALCAEKGVSHINIKDLGITL